MVFGLSGSICAHYFLFLLPTRCPKKTPFNEVISFSLTGVFSGHPVHRFLVYSIDFREIFILFYIQEDLIVKRVDLFSGFGGAMGLWLGWSVMTLGHLLISREWLKGFFVIQMIFKNVHL